MTLRSLDKNYDKSMRKAADQLDKLQQALESAGFDKKDLKTGNFNVVTEHEGVHDSNGNYKSVFKGYACIHGLRLEFDFDTALLSKALSAISGCLADPQLNIQFTVKDKDAVNEALLCSAAQDAKERAQILCRASGVKLGQLLSISYNWGELNIYSETVYGMERKCMAMANDMAMDINPQDIDVSDNATFVWEIN